MSNDPKHPDFGDMAVDATDVEVTLLTAEQIKSFTKTRAGFDTALACLSLLTPEQRKLLGITDADVADAATLKAEVERIDQLIPSTKEIVHRLHCTRIDRHHRIGMILSGAATSARRRADRDPAAAEAIGSLADLLAYVSEPGEKAAATRAKNAKAKKAGGGSTP